MKKFSVLLLICCISFAFSPLSNKERDELLQSIQKTKSELEKKLNLTSDQQIPLSPKKIGGSRQDCDSIVDMGIHFKSPNRNYSVSIICSYYKNDKAAKKAYTDNYKASIEAEKHTEGDKSPHAHFLIGKEVYNISYGCSLNKTQSEKDILDLFNQLYQKNKSVSSFWINQCGSGLKTSDDLK